MRTHGLREAVGKSLSCEVSGALCQGLRSTLPSLLIWILPPTPTSTAPEALLSAGTWSSFAHFIHLGQGQGRRGESPMAQRNNKADSTHGTRATPCAQAKHCHRGLLLGRASGGEWGGLERAWSLESERPRRTDSLKLATSWLDDTVPETSPRAELRALVYSRSDLTHLRQNEALGKGWPGVSLHTKSVLLFYPHSLCTTRPDPAGP